MMERPALKELASHFRGEAIAGPSSASTHPDARVPGTPQPAQAVVESVSARLDGMGIVALQGELSELRSEVKELEGRLRECQESAVGASGEAPGQRVGGDNEGGGGAPSRASKVVCVCV